MKVEIHSEELLHALSLAERGTGRNPTLPVLSCILVVAGKNSLIIRSTNLELGVEVEIPAKINSEGVVAIPASVLSQLITTTPEGTVVKLTGVEGNLLVETKLGKTTIKGQPSADFPHLPHVSGGKTLSIKPDVISKGIRSVAYSASTSSVKPELGSVYLYQHNGNLVFAATDSFRLAEKIVPEKKGGEFDPLIIPIRNALEIAKILEEAPTEVEVAFSKNQISFSYKRVYLTSRLIDGTFPDYRQIIPKEGVTEAILLKADFSSLLKRAMVFSDKFNQVSFSLKPSKKVFAVRSRNADVGEMDEAIPATLSGENLDINFNHRYLVDCLQSIGADSISLSFGGPGKPLVIRGVGDQAFLYLVMPMNR